MDVVVDLDGTLCLTCKRHHFLRSQPKNWAAFFDGIPFDTVNEPVFETVRSLYKTGHNVILCSARNEEHREATRQWLMKYKIYHYDEQRMGRTPKILYNKLYMRPDGDHRNDCVLKKEILDTMKEDGYNPQLAIDDRDRVVKMWRDNGVPCFQVARGDF